MSTTRERLADAEGLANLIDGLARRLVDGGPPRGPLLLVGIRSRGYPLAVRLAQSINSLLGESVEVGAVDITLYRDDLDQAERWPVLRGTEIPFDVDGSDLVLVDDVLFTGRTVRAALNAVCDLGRPARVRLAVLVDRGHRELPIQADVVGLTLATERGERVDVRVSPTDPTEEIVHVRPN